MNSEVRGLSFGGKNMGVNFKSPEFYLFCVYCLMIVVTLMIPWTIGTKYNMDVEFYVTRLQKLQDRSFIDNMKDNTFSLIVLNKIFYFLPPRVLLYLLHGFAVLFFSWILLRNLNIYYVLAIFFISFFSLYFNQSRETIAISFGILAWKNIEKRPAFGILALLMSFFFHLFAFIFIVAIIFLYLFQKLSRYKKTLTLVAVSIMGISLFAVFSRLQVYFETQGYSSYFFILLGFYTVLLWSSLKIRGIQYFFFALFILTAFTKDFLLTSRVAEIGIVFLFLNSRYAEIGFQDKRIRNFVVLSAAFAMFVYRVIVVFVFAQDRIHFEIFLNKIIQ